MRLVLQLFLVCALPMLVNSSVQADEPPAKSERKAPSIERGSVDLISQAANSITNLLPKNTAEQPRPSAEEKARLAQKLAESRELDLEAAAIQAEASRIQKTRQSLEARGADFTKRVNAHNENKPDPNSLEAVTRYNQIADQFNTERRQIEEAGKAFEVDRLQLAERAHRFQVRINDFQARWK